MGSYHKNKTLEAVHAEALERFDSIQSAVSDEREQCYQDRRFCFVVGAQWEGALEEEFENKPRFEVNKLQIALKRVISEYRKNAVTVDFVSRTGSADDDEAADVCDGLFRADVQDSDGNEAFQNAFEEAVSGGFGAWRLRHDYIDDFDAENEEQRIIFEPIYDADLTVFFDESSKRKDKSDARYAYVLHGMTKAAYKAEYNDDPETWPRDIESSEFDWFGADLVYVAEYYVVEQVNDYSVVYQSVDGSEETHYLLSELDDDDGKLAAELAAMGSVEVRRRKVKNRQIHKYILSGGKVLEDCGIIAGKFIPIVPVYGERRVIDGIERCAGLVRYSKDAQRLKNMQLSQLALISSSSAIERPILTPEQYAGHEESWANANREQHPVALINPVTNPDGTQSATPPMGVTPTANIPPAMAALLQLTEQDISDLLGNQQSQEDITANISGKAVEMLMQRADMQSYIYLDNFSDAMAYCGRVWMSMAREIYVESGRMLKTVGVDGTAGRVEIGRVTGYKKDGSIQYEAMLQDYDFDVVVDVGPSSSSKRQATVRDLTGMMQATTDPETMQVLSAMTMLNMEGEGLADIRDYFRQKLVRMGAVKPTKEEQEQMAQEAANQQPDANTLYLQAAAQEAAAKADKAQADTAKALAEAEKTKVETAKMIAEMQAGQSQILAAINEMMMRISEQQQPQITQQPATTAPDLGGVNSVEGI